MHHTSQYASQIKIDNRSRDILLYETIRNTSRLSSNLVDLIIDYMNIWTAKEDQRFETPYLTDPSIFASLEHDTYAIAYKNDATKIILFNAETGKQSLFDINKEDWVDDMLALSPHKLIIKTASKFPPRKSVYIYNIHDKSCYALKLKKKPQEDIKLHILLPDILATYYPYPSCNSINIWNTNNKVRITHTLTLPRNPKKIIIIGKKRMCVLSQSDMQYFLDTFLIKSVKHISTITLSSENGLYMSAVPSHQLATISYIDGFFNTINIYDTRSSTLVCSADILPHKIKTYKTFIFPLDRSNKLKFCSLEDRSHTITLYDLQTKAVNQNNRSLCWQRAKIHYHLITLFCSTR